MWTIVDKNSLPSVKEALQVKLSISQLESELETAAKVLEETQQRIAKLREELAQRRAYIAPIRRVPFEILSEIFVICSAHDRLAPTVIAAVSHHWRATVLATPLAWTFIFCQRDTRNLVPYDLVPTFLERNNPHLIHVCIPWGRSMCICDGEGHRDRLNVETIFKNADRIQCLAVDVHLMEEYPTETFPNLAHLIVTHTLKQDLRVCLDMSRFPTLRHLDLTGFLPPPNTFILLKSTHLPYLVRLELELDQDDVWLALLSHCAATLKALRLCTDPESNINEYSPGGWRIECPNLEYFSLYDNWSSRNVRVPMAWRILELKAPKLVVYEYTTQNEQFQVVHQHKQDNVLYLAVSKNLLLREYRGLIVLRLTWCPTIAEVLKQIESDFGICPRLQRIELTWSLNEDRDSTLQRLADRNQKAGSSIEVVDDCLWHDWEPRIPYEHTCHDDMPCMIPEE